MLLKMRTLKGSLPSVCRLIALLLLSTIISGCGPGIDTFPIQTQTHPIPAQHKLIILLDQASLIVMAHDKPYLTITGSSSLPDLEFTLTSSIGEHSTQLQLAQPTSARPINLVLRLEIPFEVPLEIIQAKGDILVHDFEGELLIETISAPIRVDRFNGNLRALSRRSLVQVSDSKGELHVLAEADEIRLSDVRGIVTGTNIMGNVSFSGTIAAGDSASFETDHGVVMVALDPGSDTQIDLSSAGGRIVCTLPSMSGTFESCEGVLGSGAGTLTIRTVTGAIRLDQKR
jgi:hypothetical protein